LDQWMRGWNRPPNPVLEGTLQRASLIIHQLDGSCGGTVAFALPRSNVFRQSNFRGLARRWLRGRAGDNIFFVVLCLLEPGLIVAGPECDQLPAGERGWRPGGAVGGSRRVHPGSERCTPNGRALVFARRDTKSDGRHLVSNRVWCASTSVPRDRPAARKYLEDLIKQRPRRSIFRFFGHAFYPGLGIARHQRPKPRANNVDA